jgi:hypothetical protein
VHSGILNDPEDNDDALGGKNKWGYFPIALVIS